MNFRLLGTFWKCARIGERKSPYVAFCCIVMAASILFKSWHNNHYPKNMNAADSVSD